MKRSPLADNRDPRKIWPNEHFGQGDQANNDSGSDNDDLPQDTEVNEFWQLNIPADPEVDEFWQLNIADPNWDLRSNMSDDEVTVGEGRLEAPSIIEASQDTPDIVQVAPQAPEITPSDPIGDAPSSIEASQDSPHVVQVTPQAPEIISDDPDLKAENSWIVSTKGLQMNPAIQSIRRAI